MGPQGSLAGSFVVSGQNIKNMTWLYLLVAIVIAVLIIEKLGVFNSKEKQQFDDFPYQQRKYLLTLAERPFFEVLERIAQKHNSYVFTKVRLEDLILPIKGTKNWWIYRNKIKSRHVDFVICDKENIRPLIAIELNDSSHLKEKRIRRDDFYRKLFSTIQLPFLEITLRNVYEETDLEEKIRSLIK